MRNIADKGQTGVRPRRAPPGGAGATPPATRSLRRDADVLEERILTLARLRPLRDPVAATCEHLALTPPQIHALLWLGEDGPLTMGELARRVAVTEKTVTGIVDRLERDGHLARERNAVDRRVVRTRLTPQGEAAYRRIDGEIHGSLQRFLGLLDASDRRAMLRIVERIIERLGMLDAGPGRGPKATRTTKKERT